MSRPTRDGILSAWTNKIYDMMLNDIAVDVGLQAHNEILRARSICDICNTRCGSVHIPSAAPVAHISRQATPSGSPSKGANGTSTPTRDFSNAAGNVLLDCTQCRRPIAASRFASHLSSCLGLGARPRRARAADGRSASPYIGSDVGAGSDDEVPKSKVKGKLSNKASILAAELNDNGKRTLSPDVGTLSKMQKKQKTSSLGSSSPALNPSKLGAQSSQSRVPSKLRPSPTPPVPPPPPPPSLYVRPREDSSSPGSSSSTGSPESSPMLSKAKPASSTSSVFSSQAAVGAGKSALEPDSSPSSGDS